MQTPCWTINWQLNKEERFSMAMGSVRILWIVNLWSVNWRRGRYGTNIVEFCGAHEPANNNYFYCLLFYDFPTTIEQTNRIDFIANVKYLLRILMHQKMERFLVNKYFINYKYQDCHENKLVANINFTFKCCDPFS